MAGIILRMNGVTELKHSMARYRHLGLALLLSSLVSVGFFVVGALTTRDYEYWYLAWNLVLAWLPLIFAVWLLSIMPRRGWSSWPGIALTLLWLAFLPNSFYMASDLIHLASLGSGGLLYDAVMFLLFVFNGLTLGFISLYLIHTQLLKRLTAQTTHTIIAVILLLCSFAIYLGRDLRWNSWDLLTNPFGILFDVSDRFINPTAHPETFTTTLAFFVLLGSIYIVVWQLARVVRAEKA